MREKKNFSNTFALVKLRLQSSLSNCLRSVQGAPFYDNFEYVIMTMLRYACLVAQVACCCSVVFIFCIVIGWNLGHGVLPFPTELFWWPQSSCLGGSGFPDPSSLNIAQVYQTCPKSRPTFSANNKHNNELNNGFSIRTSPRWIIQDTECLNTSHLDAGVCIAEPTAKGGHPTSMKCLPSFLVIGAQKAGSTDLRGLLSFHPFLGNF
jgi:hypothetical protein